ncbi:signal protein PDZ [Methylacidiphilum sp. Yel]|jgi:hypothetical protein|uniref:signal protein PDZ n=1 Tax=Methylacidiphilum sp. Yel TaxID=1847730 RepID=UPI00106DCA76|nr:signal protein PDZ [Methylacidiphilum sp. Yel]TFE66605.1 signal protein PDZ [Methylacidiphilum sp. Yel]
MSVCFRCFILRQKKIFCFFFLLFLVFPFSLVSSPLKFTPELKDCQLFIEDEEGVHPKYPFVINAYTIIPPDALLRVIYVKPQMDLLSGNPQTVEGEGGEKGGLAAAASRSTPALESEGAFHTDSPEEKEMKMIHQTVWKTGLAFCQAFDFLDADDLRIIFQEKGKKSFKDEPVSFPEGMILAQIDSKVFVVALEVGGKGYEYGMKSGDQILAINDVGINGGLSDFLSLYRKEKFGLTGAKKSIRFLVSRQGESNPIVVSIPLPPSLQGSILDEPFVTEPVKKRK